MARPADSSRDRSDPPEVPADDALGALLQALTDTLDVREVFERISAEARRIVPHDALMLGLIADDHRKVKVVALAGYAAEPPAEAEWPVELVSEKESDVFVLNDLQPTPGDATARGWLRP